MGRLALAALRLFLTAARPPPIARIDALAGGLGCLAKTALQPISNFMGKLLVLVPLFALLLLAAWFAGSAWVHLGRGEPIPFYAYAAISGGVFFSLLIGGGLMALVFYSSRHGYDDLSGGNDA
jgi:hypothetical protein